MNMKQFLKAAREITPTAAVFVNEKWRYYDCTPTAKPKVSFSIWCSDPNVIVDGATKEEALAAYPKVVAEGRREAEIKARVEAEMANA